MLVISETKWKELVTAGQTANLGLQTSKYQGFQ